MRSRYPRGPSGGEAGQPVAVVEAMKMENILRAEKNGRVKTVAASPGESLAVDAIILEFE